MISRVLLVISLVLVPSMAYAWGPLAHMYLGAEALAVGAALHLAIAPLIRRFKWDFLYGNLMADSVIGKKHLPLDDHPHNWSLARALLEDAETDQERAFCLGYLCHLAADTVAHGSYTSRHGNLLHSFAEFRADSFVKRSYWRDAINISSEVQKRNDKFLASRLKTVVLSHQTNRNVFKGYVALSVIGPAGRKLRRSVGLRSRNFAGLGDKSHIKGLYEDSLERMAYVLSDPEDSEVYELDPIGSLGTDKPIKLFNASR